jgi:hypothetical protein
LTEITVGKEQASDTDESKKMLHLEQNSVENDRGSNNPGRPVIFKVGRYIAIIVSVFMQVLTLDNHSLTLHIAFIPEISGKILSSFNNRIYIICIIHAINNVIFAWRGPGGSMS